MSGRKGPAEISRKLDSEVIRRMQEYHGVFDRIHKSPMQVGPRTKEILMNRSADREEYEEKMTEIEKHFKEMHRKAEIQEHENRVGCSIIMFVSLLVLLAILALAHMIWWSRWTLFGVLSLLILLILGALLMVGTIRQARRAGWTWKNTNEN